MPSVQQQRDKLIGLLKQLFQLDQPDLDFGFYKIMHAKSEQVQRFLENDLLDIIKKEFGGLDGNRIDETRAKYEAALQTAKDYGAQNPEEAPAVKEAKTEYENAKEGGSPEGKIYDHLWRFFERYYDNGDFLSRRYYARETAGKAAPYAIPYDGREVYLHWANKDQYYIKTSEYLSNFTFNPTLSEEYKEQAGELLPKDEQGIDNLKVHCRIVDATEGEHGNIKTSEGQQRYFIIHEAEPIKLIPSPLAGEGKGEGGYELVIQFQYRPDPEKTGQDNTWKQKRLNEAVDSVMAALKRLPEAKTFLDVFSLPAPTAKQNDRPLLAKYLNQYTARNTMDYFIHKDLGGFLNRELDFYIKNEIMRLDDIENADAPKMENYLAKIRVLRKIARHLIEFLAQLEDFQKKLWLKKKFVTETNYCITLDRIPEKFYPEIAANEKQREEWVKLFSIDEIQGDLATVAYSEPLTVEFLKENNRLILDTRNVSAKLKDSIIACVNNYEEICDGLLVRAENTQALDLIKSSFSESVKCVYIDPPYNTDAGPISYKNGYRDSSWISLMEGGLNKAKSLLTDDGIICATIDDYEQKNLSALMEQLFGDLAGTVAIRIKPSGRPIPKGFAVSHEYALFAKKNPGTSIRRLPREGDQLARYREEDEKGNFFWEMLRKAGSNSTNKDRPTMYFPLYLLKNGSLRLPRMKYNKDKEIYEDIELKQDNEIEIWPTKDNGMPGCWYFGYEKMATVVDELKAIKQENGNYYVYYRRRPNEGVQPTSFWGEAKYSATEHGTALLKKLFHEHEIFSYPKSIHAVEDCLRVSGGDEGNAIILDYFAGSGTTGHAVINFNREDSKKRKYILIEMADYFDSVLKPRMMKAAFSNAWSKGKPLSYKAGISHLFKYIYLESYEDTLNNLAVDKSMPRKMAIESNDSLRQDYMLKYWLALETSDSPSLLNIEYFTDPTAYIIKVKKPGTDEYEDKNVDLIETFNWLIGLNVEHMDIWRSFDASFKREKDPELPKDSNTKLVIDGKLKESDGGKFALRKIEGWVCRTPGNTEDREKVLVVWRKLTGNLEEDNAVLDEWFRKLDIRSRDSEFDVIYVNGSNNLPNLRGEDEHWKVRLLEETFHQKMWDIEDV